MVLFETAPTALKRFHDKVCATEETYLSPFLWGVKRREAISLLAKGYSGTPSCPGEPAYVWLGQHIPFRSEEERVKTLSFVVAISFLRTAQRGMTIALNRKTFTKSDGTTKVKDCSMFSLVEVNIENVRKNLKLASIWYYSLWEKLVEVVQILRIACELRYIPLVLFQPKLTAHLMAKADLLVENQMRYHIKYGPKEDHWELGNVVINPDLQGQGLSRELLDDVAFMADRAGKKVLLLAASERNERLYERNGYKVVYRHECCDPVDLSAPSLTFRYMVRDPQN